MITHVETTIATQTDVETTESIHSAFDAKGRLPKQHLVDSGYISAGLLVNSPIDYQVQLVGPVRLEIHWPAKQGKGHALDDFDMDWEAETVTCPQGNTPKDWIPTTDANGNPTIRIRFARSTCSGYEVLSLCTRATKDGRSLTLRANQAQHQVLREVRQKTSVFNLTSFRSTKAS